jgi:hypothetical protein
VLAPVAFNQQLMAAAGKAGLQQAKEFDRFRSQNPYFPAGIGQFRVHLRHGAKSP